MGNPTQMTKRQRVEVLLNRGMADEWVAGTVVEASAVKVELDEEPPGMARIVGAADIAEWRRAPAAPARPG